MVFLKVQTARMEAEIEELMSQGSEVGGLPVASLKHKAASGAKKATVQQKPLAPSDTKTPSRTPLPPPLSVNVSEQTVSTDCSGVSQREKSQAHSNDGAPRVALPNTMVPCAP